MRILITGATGYLGSRLSLFLSEQANFEVFTGSRELNTDGAWLPNIKTRKTDWDDPHSLYLATSDIDMVIHLAGMNAQDCAIDPTAALEVNALATARLLQAAIQQKVKRFVYFSTAHVYDSPLSGEISEASCPLNLHPYATSHRAGEDVVLAAQQRGDMEGIVIRLSNVFGPPVNRNANCWMLLVNDLCRQAIIKGKLTVHSSGMQRRDFVTLHDVERAVLHLLNISAEIIGNGIFNIGGVWAPRIIDMAVLVKERSTKIFGFTPEIMSQNVKLGEKNKELEYRIDKLINSGFKITGKPETEIDATLNFCKENMGAIA